MCPSRKFRMTSDGLGETDKVGGFRFTCEATGMLEPRRLLFEEEPEERLHLVQSRTVSIVEPCVFPEFWGWLSPFFYRLGVPPLRIPRTQLMGISEPILARSATSSRPEEMNNKVCHKSVRVTLIERLVKAFHKNLVQECVSSLEDLDENIPVFVCPFCHISGLKLVDNGILQASHKFLASNVQSAGLNHQVMPSEPALCKRRKELSSADGQVHFASSFPPMSPHEPVLFPRRLQVLLKIGLPGYKSKSLALPHAEFDFAWC